MDEDTRSGLEVGGARSYIEGFAAVVPMMLGVAPFGLICGALCVEAGMSEWEAIGLSVFVFAGASQVVIAQLMTDSGVVAIVILTALAINLRLMMYSATLAGHLSGEHLRVRALFAYFLTDQAFVISINRFSEEGTARVQRGLFYLGAGTAMWVSFNVATATGAWLGPFIPEELGLDFAIPLTFIALLVPRLNNRPNAVAAIVAGAGVLVLEFLPFNLGLLCASLLGVCCGWLYCFGLGKGRYG